MNFFLLCNRKLLSRHWFIISSNYSQNSKLYVAVNVYKNVENLFSPCSFNTFRLKQFDSSVVLVSDRVTDLVTTKLLSKCRPYLIHLSMRGCSQLHSATFTALSECRNLQDLNLSECKGLDVSDQQCIILKYS